MFVRMNILLLSLLCSVKLTTSARILCVVPTPSLSHHLFYRPIIRELSLRGHDVVSISADPMYDPSLTNLTEIDIHNEAYNAISVTEWLEETQTKPTSQVGVLRKFLPSFNKMAEDVFNLPIVKELITNPNEHFDLLLYEMFVTNAYFLAFKEHFNCPTVGMISFDSSINGMDAFGNPTHPNYYADPYVIAGSNLSFWERLALFWYNIDFRIYYHTEFIPAANEVIKKHFNIKTESAWELEKSVDLLLANTNPIFYVPRPHVPSYIEIGGMHERKRRPLPKDLKEFLDNSVQGVIYFSLGSNVKSENLPNETRKHILKAFEKLPYNILWKWGKQTLDDKPNNVLIRQWLPQQDVLNHPNVKAFVTQGGLQSLEEAIRGKVPLVAIPFGGDQEHNAYRIQEIGMGRRLLFRDITEKLLVESITDVASNPKYKNKITKIGDLLWDQPTKPLDRAIWWIEYVIRHKGAKHLRSPAADLSWPKYLLLDIIGFLVLVFSLSVMILIYVIKNIKRVFYRSSKCKKE